MEELELSKALFVAFVGLVSGFLGTNTGGGALLAIPSLIFVGVSPEIAIATTRVSSAGTMVAGIYKFHRGGKINYAIGVPAALFSSVGAFFGSYCLNYISGDVLKKMVGIVNLTVLAFMILRSRELAIQAPTQKWVRHLGMALFLFTGFLGSLLAGQAIFTTYILVLLFGQTFTEAAGTRKIAGIATSLISVIVYGIYNLIDYRYGLILIGMTLLSSYIGAGLGLKMGDRWMARLFYLVVGASSLKLIF